MPARVIDNGIAAQAARHLSAHDAVLAPVIARIGACPVRRHANYYQELVEAIISQQLSVKAAASILGRFIGLFGGSFPPPEQIMMASLDDLRNVGLSRAKASYIQDLAHHVAGNQIDFSHFDTLDNAAIIDELVAVKGIGEWTAHMFLLFCMARSDVLPYGDLGIRSGLQKLYGLPALPDKTAVEQLAIDHHWHPYESIASWYVWQSLDNTTAATAVNAAPDLS